MTLLSNPIVPYAWMDRAACVDPMVDPEIFWPSPGENASTAKAVCNGIPKWHVPACPVRETCLAWVLSIEKGDGASMAGVFGGLSASERTTIRHRGVQTLSCPHCNQVFGTVRGLASHSRQHKAVAS